MGIFATSRTFILFSSLRASTKQSIERGLMIRIRISLRFKGQPPFIPPKPL